MKKSLKIILSLYLIISLAIPCFALENPVSDNTQTDYIYFDDGSYIVTIIGNEEVISRSSTTVSNYKISTYYNSSDVAQWYVKVTGTFTYGDGTSTCTNSTCTTGIYNSYWKISNPSASKSGATAIATATGKLYQSGVVIPTVPATVKLTCDANGNFS